MSETKQRITREVIVKDYEYMADGKNARKDVIAVYFSPTNAEAKAEREAIKAQLDADPHAIIYTADTLLKRLKELRDAETGAILYKIEAENLWNETNHNLAAIENAIKEDISPKQTPGK